MEKKFRFYHLPLFCQTPLFLTFSALLHCRSQRGYVIGSPRYRGTIKRCSIERRERERERERDVPNKFNIVKSNGETHNSHVRKRANAKKS